MLNGKQEGEWIYYYNDGNRRVIKHYVKGNVVGNWRYFQKNGEVYWEARYLGGKLQDLTEYKKDKLDKIKCPRCMGKGKYNQDALERLGFEKRIFKQ